MSTDARIELLEHQVRTLKRLLLGVFGLFIAGGLLAASSYDSVPDLIQARKFQVVHPAGGVVVEMGTTNHLDNHKSGGIIQLKRDGKFVAELSDYSGVGNLKLRPRHENFAKAMTEIEGSGKITMHDIKGDETIVLNSDPGSIMMRGYQQAELVMGPTGLSIANRLGKRAIVLDASDHGGIIQADHANGQPMAGFYPTGAGGVLRIYDDKGKLLARLAPDFVSGGGQFNLYKNGSLGGAGPSAVKIGVTPGGEGIMDINDKNGKLAVGICGVPGDAGMGVWNKDGNEVVQVKAAEDGAGQVRTSDGKGDVLSSDP
jgi:hypothetical protein